MNNALKHAKASEVSVEFACNGKDCEITISDDGQGFDPTVVREDGNGLKNMKTRMETIGGTFELSTKNGSGTKVCLAFPIHSPGVIDA
jgi:two-component system sensor histidine kinase DegS